MLKRRQQLLALINFMGGGSLPNEKLHLLVFLLSHIDQNANYHFIPTSTGPYSLRVEADLKALEKEGWLSYYAGWKLSVPEAQLATINDHQRKCLQNLRSYYGDNHEALLRAVYQQAPFYLSRYHSLEALFDAKTNGQIKAMVPPGKGKRLYTMGYEGTSIEHYLNLLLKHNIQVLIDVRANPYSRKFGYKKREMEQGCELMGIRYEHVPELGIPKAKRQQVSSNEDFYNLLDHYEHRMLPQQTQALKYLHQLIAREGSIVLTCYEANAQDCHRSRIAKKMGAFTNFPVEHL